MSAGLWLWLFDLLLVSALLGLAWRLLTSSDLFRAVVLFMAFGLLVALAWARLRAPDVALAEAAVGSGITGALLLSAVRAFKPASPADDRAETASAAPGPGRAPAFLWITATLALAFAAVGGWAILALPPQAEGLAGLVAAHLDQSGVSNPVTAVLLNFRGYDTLLEIPVLVLAVLGIWSLGGATLTVVTAPPDSVLSGLVRLLVPVCLLVAGYLLWQGGHAPGGAFQAGAILAAAVILLFLSGRLQPGRIRGWKLRLLLVVGLLLFWGVAVGVMGWGGQLLEYPAGRAKGLILLIESGLTLSITAILAALFLGGRPEPEPEPGAVSPGAVAESERQ